MVSREFLHLRVRDTLPHPSSPIEKIVEVVDAKGNVFGQLPVTSVVYEMAINGLSHLTVSVLIKDAAIESHQP